MFGMIAVTAVMVLLLYASRIQALSQRAKNPNKVPNEVARHSDEIRKYMSVSYTHLTLPTKRIV